MLKLSENNTCQKKVWMRKKKLNKENKSFKVLLWAPTKKVG